MPNACQNKSETSANCATSMKGSQQWSLLMVALLTGYLSRSGNIPFLCFDALFVVVVITRSVPKVMPSILKVLSSL